MKKTSTFVDVGAKNPRMLNSVTNRIDRHETGVDFARNQADTLPRLIESALEDVESDYLPRTSSTAHGPARRHRRSEETS